MTIEDKISEENLECNINREAAKMPVLSPGKIDKYEYITDEEILPSDHSIMVEQTKYTYSTLRKAFGKQIKTIR